MMDKQQALANYEAATKKLAALELQMREMQVAYKAALDALNAAILAPAGAPTGPAADKA